MKLLRKDGNRRESFLWSQTLAAFTRASEGSTGACIPANYCQLSRTEMHLCASRQHRAVFVSTSTKPINTGLAAQREVSIAHERSCHFCDFNSRRLHFFRPQGEKVPRRSAAKPGQIVREEECPDAKKVPVK